jgi:PKD repeat protein
MRFVLIGVVLATSATACRQTMEPPTTLSMSLQANTTVVPRGDTVTFTVNATGNNLVGVIIDFGDDAMDQYATGGALSARVTFKHAYSAAGSFTVRATVTDAIAGQKEATVSIVVN